MMASLLSFLFTLTSLLSLSIAALLEPRAATTSTSSLCSSTPLPPSQDPWYTAPEHFKLSPPGTVLRVRQLDACTTSQFNSTSISSAWQLLYRTTDSTYSPSWAVTTLVAPSTLNASSSALLTYLQPYDSASVDASPSYSILSQPSTFSALITPITSQGWFFQTPDFEGPLAAFTAGVQSGHATLDAVRAATWFASSNLHLPADAPSALWGYSGGALAGEWALELAVQYAPELVFAGAALGGLTPNVTSVLRATKGTAFAGLGPAGILGLAAQWPEIRAELVSQLVTNGTDGYTAAAFLAALNYTETQALEAFYLRDVDRYFVGGLSALLENRAYQQLIDRDGIMGYHGVPAWPVYVYKAIADDVSPVGDTDALVERWCGVGVSVLYERNTVGGHRAEGTNGQASAWRWLGEAIGETLRQSGCTVRDVTVNVTDSAL